MYSRNDGFTLIELLIVMAIIAIISIYTVPNVLQTMMQKRSDAVLDKFTATFDLAKNEAIRRGETIMICAAQVNTNGVLYGCSTSSANAQIWSKGLLVYIDYNYNGTYNSGERIKLSALDSSVNITGPTNQSNNIGFYSNGSFYNGSNSNAVFCTSVSFLGLTTYETQITVNSQGILSSCIVGQANCTATCIAF